MEELHRCNNCHELNTERLLTAVTACIPNLEAVKDQMLVSDGPEVLADKIGEFRAEMSSSLENVKKAKKTLKLMKTHQKLLKTMEINF